MHDIREFVAWLSLKRLAPATIATHVSGVGFHYKIMGFPDPTQDFLVGKLLEGCRRDRTLGDDRLPISVSVLSHILGVLPHVCISQFEVVLFRAAMLGAFFGFMRLGEFAANSRNYWQDSLLGFSDVQFHDKGTPAATVLVNFRFTKTDKSGSPQAIRLVQSNNTFICPVKAFSEFVALRPPCLSSPFFCHFDGSALTRFQFNAVLRKALAFSGVGGARFSAHSFRIGAATTAFNLGVSCDGIKNTGRWRSDVVRTYIRPEARCFLPGL